MDIAWMIGTIAFGLAVGAYGTLVGAGGGFLIVPAMLLVYHSTPQQAVGTSLCVVMLNALSGTISYARQRRVDYHSGFKFALATLPGAAIGAYLSSYLSSGVFNLIFGLLLIIIALFLLMRPEAAVKENDASEGESPLSVNHTHRILVDARGDVFTYAFNERNGVIMSFFVGFFSSILGIGGGIIHVPALVHLFSFPAHVATATSHFILAISAGAGSLFHLGLRHVLYTPAVLMGTGAVAGAQAGAAISQRLRGRSIVRFLSVALIFVGGRLLLA
ncbi:MAG: sulfite exporter TauE/SafE family protein [Chloroflexi bacterium]|nr:sulfite exporter TauE/SafE family protein [Chloroflexota bacterium]MCL5075562.1 sulfite exporter TauE/SafE family protein [Chloroflexota bacterium]